MLKELATLWHLRMRRERANWIDVEAASLVRVFGDDAHAAARKRVREASGFSAIRYWGAVRDAVARGTGLTKAIGGLCETVPPMPSHRSSAPPSGLTEFEVENSYNLEFEPRADASSMN